ncbi:hypothetical protein WR25_25126 [Diploscapter pachys]|uniref:Uncharacterized protein n=1 Tax=Diploscapter pachys TaxID=2018661 RepID=A0A2A2LVU0_9BILA|nr:hypothetical protein WR25_25126 [Diploscapter pachys]
MVAKLILLSLIALTDECLRTVPGTTTTAPVTTTTTSTTTTTTTTCVPCNIDSIAVGNYGPCSIPITPIIQDVPSGGACPNAEIICESNCERCVAMDLKVPVSAGSGADTIDNDMHVDALVEQIVGSLQHADMRLDAHQQHVLDAFQVLRLQRRAHREL